MRLRSWVYSLIMLTCFGAASAEEPDPPPPVDSDRPVEGRDASAANSESALQEEMRRYFQNRLRAELALSDEQMATILPRIETLEHSKRTSRREKALVGRQLRRGLHEGASDTRLQELLDRMEQVDIDQQEFERSELKEIDAQLTVRQKIKLRLFIQRFRQEMQERVRELRGGTGRRRGAP